MMPAMMPAQRMPWPRRSNSVVVRGMACVRRHLEANDDPAEMFTLLQAEFGNDAEHILVEALQAKSIEHGWTLLMHAAALGNRFWFLTLVEETVNRVRPGRATLVKQLRAVDFDGVPLLFQAASSDEIEGLRVVKNTIMETLGVGGLSEQLRAVDRKGRNIMMYAVRSNRSEVYDRVWDMLSEHSGWEWKCRLAHKDSVGRTLLHHAAETPCVEILRKVIELTNGFLPNQLIGRPDAMGLTPVMYVLRDNNCINKLKAVHKTGHREREHDAERFRVIMDKLDMLLPGIGGRDKTLEILTQPSTTNFPPAVGGTLLSVYAQETEGDEVPAALVHAALGGRIAFGVVVSKIAALLDLTMTADSTGQYLKLNFINAALGVDDNTPDDLRHKRLGMLLANAAKGGHFDLLQDLVGTISGKTNGASADDSHNGEKESEGRDEVIGPSGSPGLLRLAIHSICERGQSLLTIAITSGDIAVVRLVVGLEYYTENATTAQGWDRLCGASRCVGTVRALACAVLTTPTTAVVDDNLMFHIVFAYLREAAKKYVLSEQTTQPRGPQQNGHRGTPQKGQHPVANNDQGRSDGQQRGGDSTLQIEEQVNKLLRAELVVSRENTQAWTLSPLGAAVLKGNKDMFKWIYTIYKDCGGEWDGEKLLGQLRETESQGIESVPDDKYSLASDGYIVANVPHSMWHTITAAFKDAQGGNESLYKWRDYFSRTVQLLAEQGNFDDLRALVKERFPLHAHIPVLLERIGDHEDNIINTVSLAVVYASNPFVVWAIASRDVSKAEIDLSMHKNGLRRLQERLDALANELLDCLPHTVRGVGRELMGSPESAQPVRSHRQGDLRLRRKRDRVIDLVGYIVVRWMLEPSLTTAVTKDGKEDPNETIDPLQYALDRRSKGLAFVNSALVLDYLHLKFWGTLPTWTSRNPFHDSIEEGFYSYLWHNDPRQKNNNKKLLSAFGHLLRFLQGWDIQGCIVEPAELASAFPHSTLLPGLQFGLAGIIGKPVAFYVVPAVRFMFELLSYLVMLGLFCWSVMLERADEIPPQEWAFYTFVLGLFYRELLEFRQALPARRKGANGTRPGLCGTCRFPKREEGRCQHRVAAAISRYLFYDTWNILDTLTILIVAGAFVFRIMALGDHWEETERRDDASPQGNFFMAQLLLALSAPLLFARVLFLSQIDDTLGPMTQIIWTMISHLARFSVFLLVIMTSFALAFHALFYTCEDNDAADAFGTFWRSLLVMFEAMLGDFNFEIFHSADLCNRPEWAYDAAVWLLVGYEIIMAILLLNLLIAVLSTVHSSVDAHAEEEFNLSRAKLIVQTGRGVAHGRLPPPFNLIKAAIGCLIDLPYAVVLALYAVGFRKEYLPAVPRPAESSSAAPQLPQPPGVVEDSSVGTIDEDGTGRGSEGGDNEEKHEGTSGAHLDADKAARDSLCGPQRTGSPGKTTMMVSESGYSPIADGGSVAHIERVGHEKDTEGSAQAAAASATTIGMREKRAWLRLKDKSAPLWGWSKRSNSGRKQTSENDNVQDFGGVKKAAMDENALASAPYSMSYVWHTFEGGVQKLLFACTMGLTAVALSAVLWIVSTPYIAWQILRWAYPAVNHPWRGYAWTVVATTLQFTCWAVIFACTCVFSVGCALASAVLWLCGVCSIIEWMWWRLTEGRMGYRDRHRRVVRQGEERGNDWREAREIAKASNYTRDGSDPGHFNVGPLLKMTTGWDMADLDLRVKQRVGKERDAKNT